MVLNILGDWYLAENQRLGNLEFFNRIGREPTFVTTKMMLSERLLCARQRTDNKCER
jgi:hypothetical protein